MVSQRHGWNLTLRVMVGGTNCSVLNAILVRLCKNQDVLDRLIFKTSYIFWGTFEHKSNLTQPYIMCCQSLPEGRTIVQVKMFATFSVDTYQLQFQ